MYGLRDGLIADRASFLNLLALIGAKGGGSGWQFSGDAAAAFCIDSQVGAQRGKSQALILL